MVGDIPSGGVHMFGVVDVVGVGRGASRIGQIGAVETVRETGSAPWKAPFRRERDRRRASQSWKLFTKKNDLRPVLVLVQPGRS